MGQKIAGTLRAGGWLSPDMMAAAVEIETDGVSETKATADPFEFDTDNITRAKMTGACRSGRDSRGTVVHLIDNPNARSRTLLGAALCGAIPRAEWSGWEPEPNEPICPKCQRKIDRLLAEANKEGGAK